MNKIHLLCNAHLDPVWLWPREEGVAEAISTFRVAADFCEQYDSFIFNHNEAVLYEWVEEHEPVLFARIQKLVKEGKLSLDGFITHRFKMSEYKKGFRQCLKHPRETIKVVLENDL